MTTSQFPGRELKLALWLLAATVVAGIILLVAMTWPPDRLEEQPLTITAISGDYPGPIAISEVTLFSSEGRASDNAYFFATAMTVVVTPTGPQPSNLGPRLTIKATNASGNSLSCEMETVNLIETTSATYKFGCERDVPFDELHQWVDATVVAHKG